MNFPAVRPKVSTRGRNTFYRNNQNYLFIILFKKEASKSGKLLYILFLTFSLISEFDLVSMSISSFIFGLD